VRHRSRTRGTGIALAVVVSSHVAFAGDPPQEVVIHGSVSETDRLRKSAEAVDVVDTRPLKTRALSVGDVLERTEGVGVRSTGSLGSSASLSLNGLYDMQIPVFLDGVPIDIAGFPQGIANVPIGLVDRVEIYRGVVPLRFGAEALGGAINLVTRPDFYGTGGAAALEAASFGVYRGSAIGRYLVPSIGFTTHVEAYVDRAKNDYPIQTEVPDSVGHQYLANVALFHNAYDARGLSLEAGFVDRPWAKRLLLKLSFSSFEKELQSNITQTIPYGGVENDEKNVGAVLRYQQPRFFGKNTELELIGAASQRTIGFDDQSPFIYDWFGHVVATRAHAGETDMVPHDSTIEENTGFGRLIATWIPRKNHELRVAVNARTTGRDGDDPLNDAPGKLDLAAARTVLTTVVGGVEYTARLWKDRVQNIAALKTFGYTASFDEPTRLEIWQHSGAGDVTFGGGDALRVVIVKQLVAKASYEHTTRFPHPSEIFGDGALIRPNIALVPEESDNVNVGLEVKAKARRVLSVTGGADGFLRFTNQQIQLLGNGAGFQYQNLLGASSIGMDVHANASILEGLFLVAGNLTYQDLRNTSSSGSFAQYDGERLPNRPWLFANGSVAMQLRGLTRADSVLSFGGDVRYVKSFFLGWESLGDPSIKLIIPDQLVFGAFVAWSPGGNPKLTSTFEVQNLGDAPTFDYFGVQKPGRSFHLKLAMEFE